MNDISRLTDAELTQALKRWVGDEKRSQAKVVAHLAEFDKRDLWVEAGFHSLFAYATRELGYAEGAAYKRIRAARAARKYPIVVDLLSSGRVSLSAVAVLSPYLTPGNHARLFTEAQGKTTRELEEFVASFAPRPDRRDFVMRLPDRTSAPPGDVPAPPPGSGLALPGSKLPLPESALVFPGAATPPSGTALPPPGAALPLPPPDFALGACPPPGPANGHSQKIEALSPERVHFGFTGSQELRRKLDRAKGLLWHKAPAGHLEDIIGAVLDFYLERRDPALRLAKQDAAAARLNGAGGAPAPALPPIPAAPASGGARRIPQTVKDAVWRRDGGRCAYVSPGGRRCDCRSGLEYDHILPWAFGGRSNTAENVRLLCATHNRRAARELGLLRPPGPRPEPPGRGASA